MKLTLGNIRLIGGGETHVWLTALIENAKNQAEFEQALPVNFVGALNRLGYVRKERRANNVFVCTKPNLPWKEAALIVAEETSAAIGRIPFTGPALELIRWGAPDYVPVPAQS